LDELGDGGVDRVGLFEMDQVTRDRDRVRSAAPEQLRREFPPKSSVVGMCRIR
jgi:hypothetical protein